MKEKTKNKIKSWSLTFAFAGLVSLFAFGTAMKNHYSQTLAYSVNDYQDSVTFSAEELNNCSYKYLVNLPNYSTNNFSNSYIYYNNTLFNYESYDDGVLVYLDSDNSAICFNNAINEDLIYKFSYFYDWENDGISDFEYSMTIYSSFFAENMAKAMTLSKNQLNNYEFTYLSSQLVDLASDSVLQDSYIIYRDTVYTFYSWNSNGYIEFSDSDEELFISFNNVDANKWTYTDVGESETYLFTDSITIFSDYLYDNMFEPSAYQDVSFATTLNQFIAIIVGGIQELAQGIATGVVAMATGLFIDSGSLSTFGGIVGIFAGLALAVGITTKVYTWVTSLGN